MKQGIVIFSGYNQRAIIAFLRTLEKNKIEDYYIIAASKSDPILVTTYKSHVIFIRDTNELNIEIITDVIDVLREKNELEKVLIAPSTEALNRFILAKREKLSEHHIEVPLVSKDLYEQISDKYSFGRMCEEDRIAVPGEIDFPEFYTEPFVAKPKKYFTSLNKIYSPEVIKSETEYKHFTTKFPVDEFYYQKYISGKSYYLLYYFDKSQNVHCLVQENIAQQPNGKSIVAAKLSKCKFNQVDSKFRKMFTRIGFTGLVMIELRISKDSQIMIEANPRFWGPSQLFVDAGYNYFELFLKDNGFISNEIEMSVDDSVRYFWSGGYYYAKCQCRAFEFNALLDTDMAEYKKWDIYSRLDTMNIFQNEYIK